MSANIQESKDIIDQLRAICGAEHVLTDDADREFFAMDVYRSRELPLAVVQPGSVSELQDVARIASAAGVALVPRGGGASYTDGYLPATSNSLLIDTERMNAIVETNTEDMYVTVEPGITWAEMTAALAEQGVRTAFWGPFSGLRATVGGSMSQNAVSLGSGNYGCSADTALSFDIVVANGEILSTGSKAMDKASPFFRHYGPDLTGLFTGDAGAFGIKARITLRLIQVPACSGTASFGFTHFDAMADGMTNAARTGAAADCFGLDPKLQQGQLGSTNTKDAVQAVWAVLKTSTNPIDGFVRVLKMALAGKRFLTGFDYSAHYVVEGSSQAEIRAKLAIIRKAMAGHGTEIANTIPTVLRAMPFIPLYPILGPRGQRWVPMHGILPFSRLKELNRRISEVHATHAVKMESLKIEKAAMFTSISTNGFLYEPVFYWEDDRTPYHKRYLPQEYLDMLPEYASNPEGRAFVGELRAMIQEIFCDLGAVHMQVGKSYPYLKGRQGQATQILKDVKKSLDPDGLMNPGALGGLEG
ncbi:MAG: FAD-binding oxidoreductase [Gammaproteobacteria bacterium]|jgi:FAD/FMN-containing dehydrogenase|nr:FAD-binding oxidoreductase [Chromatiales bacterium]MDP6673789.1 FAD-binding oxidoreductase [Gammaproteobacteria bacterium]